MRTLVDLGEARVRSLDQLASRQEKSRAAVIREAVDAYLQRHGTEDGDDAFGLWGEAAPEGLAYQARLRSEW